MTNIFSFLQDIFRFLQEVGYQIYDWLNKLTVFLVIGFVIFKVSTFLIEQSDISGEKYFACKTDEIYGGLLFSRIMGSEKDEVKLLRLNKNSALVMDFDPVIREQSAADEAKKLLNRYQNRNQSDRRDMSRLVAALDDSNWMTPRKLAFDSSSTTERILIERRWDPILKRNGLAQWDGERFNEVLIDRSSLLFIETERGSELSNSQPVSQGHCFRVPQLLIELELERQEYDLEFMKLNAMRDALLTKFLDVEN